MVRQEAARKKKSVGSAASPPVSIDDKQFQWTGAFIDHEYVGKWDWNLAPKEAADVLRVLGDMSSLTWREVKDQRFNSNSQTRQLHHSQGVDTICSEAQQRLEALQLDLEEVFRLRHGNTMRIWGYQSGPVFHVVWFDRNHRVCPQDR